MTDDEVREIEKRLALAWPECEPAPGSMRWMAGRDAQREILTRDVRALIDEVRRCWREQEEAAE